VDIVSLEEKPVIRTKVNAGIYVVSPGVLDLLPADGPCDMPEFFETLRRSGERTIVYPTHESWVDIGRPDDYEFAMKESE
jgi:NDP-sugar pyrophosphorylase family protein